MTELLKDPNRHTSQSYSKLGEGVNSIYQVNGYHNYEVCKYKDNVEITIGGETAVKQQLIAPWLYTDKSVLDLGCNSGAMSLSALMWGARDVAAVDMDVQCIDLLLDIKISYGLEKLHLHHLNLTDLPEVKYDYVFAFALIHWVYSCTAVFGGLDLIMKWLSRLTIENCFVEWIDPQDSAMSWFKHTEYNPDDQLEPYTFDNFMKAGRSNFNLFEKVGEVRGPTRVLYRGSNC